MKTLEAGITSRYANPAYAAVHLVEMVNGGTTYRFTDGPADISYGGFTWTHLPFTVGQIVTTDRGVQAVELGFEDQNDVIKALVLLYAMDNWPVVISELWMENGAPVGRVILLDGVTDGVEMNEEGDVSRAAISVTGTLFPEQTLGPRDEFRTQCRFRFKDDRCGHGTALPGAGNTSHTDCPRTYGACIERNNKVRYGGFRWAPTTDTRIKFGPTIEIYLKQRTFVDNRPPVG